MVVGFRFESMIRGLTCDVHAECIALSASPVLMRTCGPPLWGLSLV